MVTAPPDASAKSGWGRWRGPALFASVCLNLFLIGLMIGGVVPPRHRPHWLGGPPPHARMAEMPPGAPGQAMRPGAPGGPGREGGGPGGGGAQLAFRQAVQALPDADRRAFEEAMEAVRGDIQSAQRELRQARLRVNDAIRAEPFNKGAVLDALADVRRRLEAIQQRQHAGTAEALAKLSPDSRRQFAENLSARGRP
ncbi:MAG: periplasmic heavy metal sensor [Rhodospirillales bacterium]|nr:periplasmic heavy metal sensor [Rhodospirillales bacterium]